MASVSTKNKVRALVKRGDELKQQVALQGITFELILIDNLEEKMREFA